jgi:hypothetical protein
MVKIRARTVLEQHDKTELRRVVKRRNHKRESYYPEIDGQEFL